jgi:glycine cleavage system H protein
MSDYLEFTVDKFTFKVATDRNYSPEGLWVKQEDHNTRIGISDYLQQRSGDVAFSEVKSVGTDLVYGDELAAIETIKVNISLPSPVSGRVISVNPKMVSTPEIINQDPYGDGWLAMISVMDFSVQMKHLLDAQCYYEKIRLEAEQEAGK